LQNNVQIDRFSYRVIIAIFRLAWNPSFVNTDGKKVPKTSATCCSVVVNSPDGR